MFHPALDGAIAGVSSAGKLYSRLIKEPSIKNPWMPEFCKLQFPIPHS